LDKSRDRIVLLVQLCFSSSMIGWRWLGPTGIPRDLFAGVRERLQPPPPPAAKGTKGGRFSSPATADRTLAPTPVAVWAEAAVLVVAVASPGAAAAGGRGGGHA